MLDSTPRKILVGVTGDQDIRAALAFAAGEARRRGTGVHLVHAVHPVHMAPDGATVTVEDHAVRKLGRKALADASLALEHELGEDLPVSTELVRGTAPHVLVDIAQHACLVVLQHQRMGKPMLVPSLSTTNPVAALSPVPVVAVPAEWAETADRRGVTVGVDDPDRSREIVRAALEEARRRGTSVRLLHAWHYSTAYDDLVFEGDAGRRHEAEQAEGLTAGLEAMLARYRDVQTEVVVVHARAADALVDESHRAALLVVGRHRHAIPLGPHLGSVARATLRHATCPVLVVDPVRAATQQPAVATSTTSVGSGGGS
ncbi:universal stress protein [Nocardioides endophyticus]|uniref:Universal stress protein n=1 Tax=Nocardioides endophyticus TaxID=1353775 RepID=A0ABP8Z1V1_9ACTN